MTKIKRISTTFIILSIVFCFLAGIVTLVGITRHNLLNNSKLIATTNFEVEFVNFDYHGNAILNVTGEVNSSLENTVYVRFTINTKFGLLSDSCYFMTNIYPGNNTINQQVTTNMFTGISSIVNISSIQVTYDGNEYDLLSPNQIWSWTLPIILFSLTVFSIAGMIASLIIKSNKIIKEAELTKQVEESLVLQTQIKNAKLKMENETLKTQLDEITPTHIECIYCGADVTVDKTHCHSCGGPLKHKNKA